MIDMGEKPQMLKKRCFVMGVKMAGNARCLQ